MSFDADTAMQNMYRDALMEQTVRKLQTDPDWRRFRAITDAAQRQTVEENESYKADYALRVDKARQDLIRKAGAKTFDHPTPYGTDRFNKDQINRQAQKNVRHEHERKLHSIREAEVSGYEALGEDIRSRGRLKDHAHDDFARAVDRRAGQDRRMSGPER